MSYAEAFLLLWAVVASLLASFYHIDASNAKAVNTGAMKFIQKVVEDPTFYQHIVADYEEFRTEAAKSR